MALFESLSDKLQSTFANLKGKGKLSEADVKQAMREVKLALLEADVNFKVVKQFINKVTERAVGQEIMKSLTPAQHVVKIVNEELTQLMGQSKSPLEYDSSGTTVIMMVGLQGAGKTTTCGKLAKWLKSEGKRPLLVACDIYRPAAISQLKIVGEKVETPVFEMGDKIAPEEIAKAGYEHGLKHGNNVIIIDTAGRLHIDDELMDELGRVKEVVKPYQTLLVLDSMTGQDAVNVAETFNEKLSLDGLIMTKLDGDTRGGAALSVRAVTGTPIKFACIGEKLSDIEQFHPDRMASRILGMGDVLTLIEKAQQNIDAEKAKEMEEKLRKASFDFNDFLDQLQQMKNMGPLSDLLGMMPGMNSKALKNINVDDKELVKVEAIIQSMTLAERSDANLINASRKKRIAAGSGTRVQDVNRLLKQFKQTQKMMKQLSGMTKRGKRGGFNMPFFQ